MTQPVWPDLLAPGESVLWQGRPDPALSFNPGHLRTLFMVAFIAIFALLVVFVATDVPLLMRLVGLGVLALVLRAVLDDTLLAAWLHRRTWYALTTRRAIIVVARPLMGHRISDCPITAATLLASDGGDPLTLTFTGPAGSGKFANLADGLLVMGLMRQIQAGTV